MTRTDALVARHELETQDYMRLHACMPPIDHALRQVRDLLELANALESDLATNAAMLARQCDMARQAENDRDTLSGLLREVMRDPIEHETGTYAVVQMSLLLRRDIAAALARLDSARKATP